MKARQILANAMMLSMGRNVVDLTTVDSRYKVVRGKALDDRIEEGRSAPKPEPVPKFKHREQKRRKR